MKQETKTEYPPEKLMGINGCVEKSTAKYKIIQDTLDDLMEAPARASMSFINDKSKKPRKITANVAFS